MRRGKMQARTIRRGAMMYPRADGERPERSRHDRDILGLPTTCPNGEPGWSFVWTRRGIREYWCVRDEDTEAAE